MTACSVCAGPIVVTLRTPAVEPETALVHDEETGLDVLVLVSPGQPADYSLEWSCACPGAVPTGLP